MEGNDVIVLSSDSESPSSQHAEKLSAYDMHRRIMESGKSLAALRLTALPPATHKDPTRGDLPDDFDVVQWTL